MTDTQQPPTQQPAQPVLPAAGPPPVQPVSIPTQRTAPASPTEPPRSSRPKWLVPVAILAAFIFGVIVGSAGSHGSASTSTGASANGAAALGTISMPNFVGTSTLQQASDQLRAALGQQVSVQAPGGDKYASSTVASQSPSAGTPVTSSTVFSLYPSSPDSTTAAAPSTDAAPDPSTAGTYTAGTYTVGDDIQPGTYTTPGSDYCYWKRSKDNSGEVSSIIANQIVNGRGTMTVKATDKFVEFDGTCTWTKK